MAVTDIHWRIKQAALAAIQGLRLPGDDVFGNIDQRVYSQLWPDLTGLLMPCVLLTTEGEKEEDVGGDSIQNLYEYPVRVWIMDTESPRKHEKERLYLSWRKAIMDLFNEAKLWLYPTVPEGSGSRIVTEVIFDQRLPQYQHVVSGLVVWTLTNETRPAVKKLIGT